MEIRETIIRNGLNKWAINNFSGILCYGTGSGKSFAAILATEHYLKNHSENVLLVCPTEVVIENLKAEFIKFKRSNLLIKCEFICYASINKVKKQYSLIVLDEIHHVTSDNRMKFFNNKKYKALLGLSASLTKIQLETLNPFIKVVDTLTLDEARDLKLVSEYTILNYPIKLTLLEREEYDKVTAIIDATYANYRTRAWKFIGLRSNIIYNARNKLKILPSIIELFKNEYGIVFSLTKEQSDNISSMLGDKCVSIHSGKSKKEKELLQKSFSDGRTKVKLISTAKIFDEGVTLPRLTFSVTVAAYSKTRQTKQRVGRTVRVESLDKHAINIRLYVENTQEEEWVKVSQDNFKTIKINSYEELKRTINKIRGKD